MTVSVLGLPVQNVTMEEAVNEVYGYFSMRESKIIVTPNAEILQMVTKDEAVREAMAQADYVVPDGVGVLMAAKRLGTPLKEKVAGVELGTNLLKRSAENGKRVYFLGAKPGIAAEAKRILEEEMPGIRIVGVRDGYFKPEDEPAIVEEINELDVDMLFVCLGAPKQELWMAKHKKDLRIGAMLGLGGTLDVLAHNVKRAPRWMINCKLEWLYRTLKEPHRIGRIASLPFFLLRVKKYNKTTKPE
ncbi:MAG: WecB/TagA/CpsF family glycosyltransferase [Clostridia bacterium]|nr:WecB/TagA/CpsF family glycosyltransferase [Clostridia bacterium]